MTENGRAHTVLVSAHFFGIMLKGHVARLFKDLDDKTLHAIAGSSVSPEHAGRDDLLKDWKP